MSMRYLTEKEIDLITKMLSTTNQIDKISPLLASIKVEDLNDGGMGSIRVVSKEKKIFGRELVKKDFVDADSVPVFVSINLDTEDNFFELDIWKADYSPLKQFPAI